MRGLKGILSLIVLGAGLFYLFQGKLATEDTFSSLDLLIDSKQTSLEIKASPTNLTAITGLEGDLYKWIGKGGLELENRLGKPHRKDLSSYGYTWWVYTNKAEQHIQFGVKDNKIVTVFATGDKLSTDPISIGQSYDQINDKFELDNDVSFSKGATSYRFHLTSNDMRMRPLVQIGDDSFVQFYFDTFTERLSSIRVLTADILLTQRPYEVFYRGDLPDPPLLNHDQWKEVEKGMEQQIFEITNIVRTRFERRLLDWDDPIASVAFGHSKDMSENNYFSHYTQAGEGLRERLTTNEIHYLSAGENIAAQYTDGPAAVEGWLNSEGHREALLKNDYTHLGVGVYKYYYTQNFLQKFE
ncbi:CAP domain-containing protein [Aquibacillus saliphilus]|uniref:CAP domain-containing protein n=1 Tax=Aquibacillus saliphilus TaxID=1909422 RepID=UPI001CF0BCC0|nr:CAP domain-containing protein [Aquibacillus saliphilus]